MKMTVIIPTRNRGTLLQRSLQALAQQVAAPCFEVIVVDNGSSDDTSRVLAHPPTGLELIALREDVPNRALARNRGIALARGEVLVFIDDDVIVPTHFLRAHADAHIQETAKKQRVVCGPILTVGSFNEQPVPTFFHQSRAFFCTCNASVATAVVREVGAFDEGFTAYGWEDTELGVRLRNQGLARYFSWQAYVYHLKPLGWENFDAAIVRMQEKGRMARRFVQKTGHWRVRLATGDHFINHLRGTIFGASWTMPIAHHFAQDEGVPRVIRALARAQYLDGIYRAALRGEEEHSPLHAS